MGFKKKNSRNYGHIKGLKTVETVIKSSIDKKIGEDESKKSEKKIQNLTDTQISELEKRLREKEKEIMTV